MARWDTTLNWGPDIDDDDEGIAAVIAAAIHDLASQQAARIELVRATLSTPQPDPPQPVTLMPSAARQGLARSRAGDAM